MQIIKGRFYVDISPRWCDPLREGEYGITVENQLTVNWFMEHPRVTAGIQKSMVNQEGTFGTPEKIQQNK